MRPTIVGFLLLLLSLPCAHGGVQSRRVPLQWNSAALQGIRDAKLGAPVVARALAIVHTCMYDAWAAYDERAVGTQLAGALRRPASERTLANKEQAISYAAYRPLPMGESPLQYRFFNANICALTCGKCETP